MISRAGFKTATDGARLAVAGVLGLAVAASHPTAPLVIVSATRNPAAMRQVVEMGAAGFIPKSADSDTIGHALGTILDGEETVQQCGQRIFDLMLKTASGQPTKSESFDFGGAEFAPWVLGATM